MSLVLLSYLVVRILFLAIMKMKGSKMWLAFFTSNFPPLFALWAVEWALVWFTWSIFFLRKEKCKHARSLLAVGSSCWSAREKLRGKQVREWKM